MIGREAGALPFSHQSIIVLITVIVLRRVLFGQPGRRCSVPIDRFSTPTGGSSAGGMVPQGVSKYCNFNEDFRYVFKSAVGAVVYELR